MRPYGEVPTPTRLHGKDRCGVCGSVGARGGLRHPGRVRARRASRAACDEGLEVADLDAYDAERESDLMFLWRVVNERIEGVW